MLEWHDEAVICMASPWHPEKNTAADIGSNPSYWQPTMQSAFCDLLASSTGTELPSIDAWRYAQKVVNIAHSFRSKLQEAMRP
ncbi:hypothetical protein LH51_09845 [Nitrincola sp. A-D6]|uniref:hypothetical protein n=1 Tax=Nitrincola sp. A-D6 TaxID=1545442 RepID=UPI00051FB6CC|nr:hypothetical protein [Nitrincola sp. A-D6]KGK41394.1 hypothetical protein LH51_15060 [Nitrincola sp. A-D6]KGK42124.1 hypothetical protein LH51_09845 [Nitrincola sp. A-D6]